MFGKLIILIIILAALGALGLLGYGYVGELTPETETLRIPVTLDAQ